MNHSSNMTIVAQVLELVSLFAVFITKVGWIILIILELIAWFLVDTIEVSTINQGRGIYIWETIIIIWYAWVL